MFENFAIILQQNCFLVPDKPVMVGVSGGPDSLCLFDLISRSGYTTIAAHLNHGLRPEAGEDARLAERAADAVGAAFVLESADVRSFAAEHSLSLEEAGRELRYRFLFAAAARHQAQAVAVAHSADDQVETVLMHLLRGTGLSGLKGMQMRLLPNAWSDTAPLVRPLLGTWREEIEAYIAARGLQPAIDATNRDTTLFRNRLRHELIPYLESYNPGVKAGLLRMAEVLEGDHRLLLALEQVAWESAYAAGEAPGVYGLGVMGFRYSALRRLDPAMQRRLVRKGVSLLHPGLRDIDYASIERALDFIAQPTRSRQMDLVANLSLRLEGDRLWLGEVGAEPPSGDWPQVSGGGVTTLTVPGSLELGGGWAISASTPQPPPATLPEGEPDPFAAWLDASLLELPLQVRSRVPGDRFQPLGMENGSVKVSEFMINGKVPQRARPGWPLVLSGERIAWVAGLRLAHPFRVTVGTRQAVQLHLYKRSFPRVGPS